MSRTAEVRLPFGEGEDKLFALTIKPWESVQTLTDMGPLELLATMHPFVMAVEAKATIEQVLRLGATGRWRPAHARAVLLHGLVGGGMAPTEAEKLCRANCDERPFTEYVPIAYRVLYEGCFGAGDERASGEPKGDAKGQASPGENSATAKTASTPSARRPASRRKTSAG